MMQKASLVLKVRSTEIRMPRVGRELRQGCWIGFSLLK